MPNRFDKWIGRTQDSMKMLFEHRVEAHTHTNTHKYKNKRRAWKPLTTWKVHYPPVVLFFTLCFIFLILFCSSSFKNTHFLVFLSASLVHSFIHFHSFAGARCHRSFHLVCSFILSLARHFCSHKQRVFLSNHLSYCAHKVISSILWLAFRFLS